MNATSKEIYESSLFFSFHLVLCGRAQGYGRAKSQALIKHFKLPCHLEGF